MPAAHPSTVTPAAQAERILAAWSLGDQLLLQQELEKTRELGCGTWCGLEQERLELLQAVSEAMLRKDRTVGRCLGLLAHLAHARCVAADSN